MPKPRGRHREPGKRAKDAAVTTEKIAASVVNTVKRHPVICGVLILLCFWWSFHYFAVFLVFQYWDRGLGSIAASTYLAEDQDINNAELYLYRVGNRPADGNRPCGDRPAWL